MLLQIVCEKSGHSNEKWWEKQSLYFHLWESEYEAVIDSYLKKVHKYANLWHESEAGKQFKIMVTRARYRFCIQLLIISRKNRSRLPTLTIDNLKSLEAKGEKGEKETFLGIEWGYKQIFDIFTILSQVVKTTRVSKSLEQCDNEEEQDDLDDRPPAWLKVSLVCAQLARTQIGEPTRSRCRVMVYEAWFRCIYCRPQSHLHAP
jgi:hypothetical protein